MEVGQVYCLVCPLCLCFGVCVIQCAKLFLFLLFALLFKNIANEIRCSVYSITTSTSCNACYVSPFLSHPLQPHHWFTPSRACFLTLPNTTHNRTFLLMESDGRHHSILHGPQMVVKITYTPFRSVLLVK